jgi:hypothetical protein
VKIDRKVQDDTLQLVRVWLVADERVREQQPSLAKTLDDFVLSLADAGHLTSYTFLEEEIDRRIRPLYRPITTALVAAGVDPRRRK